MVEVLLGCIVVTLLGILLLLDEINKRERDRDVRAKVKKKRRILS